MEIALMKTLQILFLSIICFSALGVGTIFLVRPEYPFGLSSALLAGTPFADYFMPGLLLIVLVAIPCMIGIIRHIQEKTSAFGWTLYGGGVSLLWLIIQIGLWNEYLWFQWAYMILCAMLILISFQLKHKELI
jgi:hypothetical protein